MAQYQIGVIVGSLRKDSYNRTLAKAVIRLAPADFSFKLLEIGDLPLYNQDDDEHQAPSVQRLKQEILDSQGLLLVTPEYNRSIPGVLKNAIDNSTRPPGQNVWDGKPLAIIGISIGAMGTALAQQHLRNICAFLNTPTLGQPEIFLQLKDGLFDEVGNIGEKSKGFLQGWMDRYAAWVRLHNP